MKTKITILAFVIALFGFSAANAQGRGNGKGKGKGNSSYAKMNKKNKHYDRDVIYRDDVRRTRDVIYRDRDRRNDRVYRGGNIYYPNQNVRNLPPGQAKKIYGHQSAKAFAPGQQKKAYNNVYYPQRRVINDRRYDDNYYRQRQAGGTARRIGSIFGL